MEQYITALYSLVETCNYGMLKEEMLHDHLVVGIADLGLSGSLQLHPDLTLEKAKKTIRKKEAVSEQNRRLIKEGSKSDSIVVEQVKYGAGNEGRKSRGHQRKAGKGTNLTLRKSQTSQTGANGSRHLGKCGGKDHPQGRCPALGVSCFRCNRKGHFGSQYDSKTVAEMELKEGLDNVTSGPDVFLGTVSSEGSRHGQQLFS